MPTSSADQASYGTAPLLTGDPATGAVPGRREDDDSSFATADLAPTRMVEGPPASFQSGTERLVRACQPLTLTRILTPTLTRPPRSGVT